MALHVDKLKELEYDEVITLKLIESDEDLTTVFREVTPISFKLLTTIAIQGKLNSETKELMRGLFDSIICTKTEYINRYIRFADSDGCDISIGNVGTPVEEIETTENTVEVIEVVEPVVKVKQTKEKNENVLPRRYGKEKILKDIEAQGGKANPTQRAMLKVNDLKNIYVNLSARGIKDMIGGTNLLSDEDCRKITSVITIAERQLLEILKKK
jgi:hypothetical protein